jgi:hypothetical protein
VSAIDFSKLCCNDYPALVWYWKSTGKDLCNRGTRSDRGLNIEFESQTDRLSIEFKVLRENQKLQVILWGLDASHRVVLEMSLDDVPPEATLAYERFVWDAEDYDEVGFARRHKRFQQWELFVDLFSKISLWCSLPIRPSRGNPSPLAAGQFEDHMIWDRHTC